MGTGLPQSFCSQEVNISLIQFNPDPSKDLGQGDGFGSRARVTSHLQLIPLASSPNPDLYTSYIFIKREVKYLILRHMRQLIQFIRYLPSY